jgi:hypothetical protein
MTGTQFDFATKDEFFEQEFIAIVKWDRIIFRRPTIDTTVRIRRASKIHNTWKLSLSVNNITSGKYEIEQQDDNLIMYL